MFLWNLLDANLQFSTLTCNYQTKLDHNLFPFLCTYCEIGTLYVYAKYYKVTATFIHDTVVENLLDVLSNILLSIFQDKALPSSSDTHISFLFPFSFWYMRIGSCIDHAQMVTACTMRYDEANTFIVDRYVLFKLVK